jgi:hypothetical protein
MWLNIIARECTSMEFHSLHYRILLPDKLKKQLIASLILYEKRHCIHPGIRLEMIPEKKAGSAYHQARSFMKKFPAPEMHCRDIHPELSALLSGKMDAFPLRLFDYLHLCPGTP